MPSTSSDIPEDVRLHYERICAHPDFRRAEERKKLLWHLLLQTYSVIAPTDSGVALAASFYGATDDENQQEKDHSKIRQAVPKLSLALAAYYRRVPREAVEFIIVAGRRLEIVRHHMSGEKSSPSGAAKLDSESIAFAGHSTVEKTAISRIAEEIGELRTFVEERLSDVVLRAVHEALLAEAEASGKLARAETGTQRQAMEIEEWKRLYRRAVVEMEPRSAKHLLAGDLAAAARIKDRVTKQGDRDAAERARDLFELGLIYKLQLDFPQALEALRESWNLTKNPVYGFELASCAQHQNRYDEAISAYEAVKPSFMDLDTRSIILNNLAGLYLDTRRPNEAEVSFQNAIVILRPLARAPHYLPRLAGALTNLAWLCCKGGRMEEAAALHQEAIAIVRKLRKLTWPLDQTMVAAILFNLATFYRQTGRPKRAEGVYRESVSTCRKAEKTDPVTASYRMSRALEGLAYLYLDARRLEEAEACCQEAVTLCRKRASQNAEAFSPQLTEQLVLLGTIYTALRRLNEALKTFQEAEAVCRKLVDTHPQAHLGMMGKVLYGLGILYKRMHQGVEAENAHGEALAIYARLEKASPGFHLEAIACTLTSLAQLQAESERLAEAETRHQEAINIYRQLARSNPTGQLSGLANALTNLSLLQSDMHKVKEAEAAYHEAHSIYQDLAEHDPGTYLPHLETMLIRCANRYYDRGQLSETESPLSEALIIGRRLAMINSKIYLPHLLTALSLFGLVCLRTQRLDEAEMALSECVAIDRTLSDASPSPSKLMSLAKGLTNIGVLYRVTQRMDLAQAAFEESARIYRTLLDSDSDSCLPLLASTLRQLAEVHQVTVNWNQAESVRREEQTIRLMLAATRPRD